MDVCLSDPRLSRNASYFEGDEGARRAHSTNKETSGRIIANDIRGITGLAYVGNAGITTRVDTQNRL